ncbi:integral membrane sensor signal transduction histidine kinase [Denitrovibrio acetiphilus DSM 12809]|uniref:histidine kinase n=1 Tax=Denitrovibrio acetiphilus (strain DSM 12809 / NBRC 114555 / N2460) TaxID=522772 RepID=D4H3E5_DENA2|nr:sensor histidine kinase [Denitrovibrio acetiphilus]ADD67229.1 integral membrane sensor signal transduction histidine kinase [Denitrovibrio acetiphilus DSM 12809]
MIKRLAIYISVLVVFILSMTTGIYFAQSKKLIQDDVKSQAELILRMKRNDIEDFLDKARFLTIAIAENADLKTYFKNPDTIRKTEDLFMSYCKKIEDIQAMRLVAENGDIKVFVRECEILSRQPDYEPINIADRNFFQKVRDNNSKVPVFSDFERGHLPDATSFCPSMIRALIPVFEGEEVLGYLIINFWGSKIGETVSQLDNKRGGSFIAETNRLSPERNGIFLFHNDRKYEFANQFGTSYFFDNVYGSDAFKWLQQENAPILESSEGYMFCTTLNPYMTEDQSWKICTILNSDYFFRSLHLLRRDFLAVLFFSIFLSILTAVVFSRYFMKPYAEIKSAVKAYSGGDFDHELKGEYKGEINEIVLSIRSMAASLKEYIRDIRNTQTKLELMNRLSALGVMAGGVAHELNTPLNSIIVLTGLLEDEIPEQSEDLCTIKNEAKRCVDIIQNLRKLAPSKNTDGLLEEVDMKHLIEETVKYMDFKNGISVELHLQNAKLKGYTTLLQQVLVNLIQNAMDAIESDGLITIELINNEDHVMLIISDTGSGIDDENIHKIFDPFHTSKSPEKGMGLGLSLVYSIIKKHGGQINVDSQINRGTRFIIRLEKEDESCSD